MGNDRAKIYSLGAGFKIAVPGFSSSESFIFAGNKSDNPNI
jgi:hypothetical protein